MLHIWCQDFWLTSRHLVTPHPFARPSLLWYNGNRQQSENFSRPAAAEGGWPLNEPFFKSLNELQPSQLYISAAKLARVRRDFDPQRPASLAPIPIKALGGRVIMTDGHTRALAALLAGLAEVPVVWDEDDLDWEAYQICVDWCLAEGIRTVADLQDRVVLAAEYEVVWHQRCREMQRDLALARQLDTDEHR
jgi:hypothetical protein